METNASTVRKKVPIASGVYVFAIATILYPAYGPGSFIRQGLGTTTEVIAAAVISLGVTALIFGTRLIARPLWAFVAAILGLVGSLGGAEWTGVPVVLGGAAAYFANQARQRGESPRLAMAAIVIGVLAILATIALAVFEPLTD